MIFFIQGLFGNQGSIYPKEGLFFENCGDIFNEDYNSKGCYVSNLHGQTGANSSYLPLQMKLLELVIIPTHISQMK